MQVMFNRAMLTVQQHSADAGSQDSSELSLRLYPAAASSSSWDQAPEAAQVCVPALCKAEGLTDRPVCQASQMLLSYTILGTAHCCLLFLRMPYLSGRRILQASRYKSVQ